MPVYDNIVVCEWCKKFAEYSNAFAFLPGKLCGRPEVANLRICPDCEAEVVTALVAVAERCTVAAGGVPDELQLARKKALELEDANADLNNVVAYLASGEVPPASFRGPQITKLPSVVRARLSAGSTSLARDEGDDDPVDARDEPAPPGYETVQTPGCHCDMDEGRHHHTCPLNPHKNGCEMDAEH